MDNSGGMYVTVTLDFWSDLFLCLRYVKCSAITYTPVFFLTQTYPVKGAIIDSEDHMKRCFPNEQHLMYYKINCHSLYLCCTGSIIVISFCLLFSGLHWYSFILPLIKHSKLHKCLTYLSISIHALKHWHSSDVQEKMYLLI